VFYASILPYILVPIHRRTLDPKIVGQIHKQFKDNDVDAAQYLSDYNFPLKSLMAMPYLRLCLRGKRVAKPFLCQGPTL